MSADVDAFYSDEPIELWKEIIGEDLHYNFGYYESNEDLATGVRQTVRNLYPYIPEGARVLDVGCGWGGPARQLRDERGCTVEGITISAAQADYCRQSGLNVRHADIEAATVEGHYDVALFLQSSEHMVDKAGVFGKMRACADRLVVSATCVADTYVGARQTFGESIVFCSPTELRALVEGAGWQTRSVREWRAQSVRSVFFWKQNLDRVFGDDEPPGQLGVLRTLSEFAMRDLANWCRAFPLIDLIAD